MVSTCASEAASSSAAHQRPCRVPLQEAQDPESELKVVMEDVDSDDATRNRSDPGKPIREANTTTDEEDAKLVYDYTHFQRDKVRGHYFGYYHGCRIIVERGATIKEFDERAPRVRAMMDAQGWIDMVEDHRPAVEEIVYEFYANLHQRRGDSFRTWLKGTTIKVTPTLISMITGVPCVCDPTYLWPVNHLPARVDVVVCFAEGRPHQMELNGEGSFQMSDFSNDVRCIYHILVSQVFPVISHMLITIKRARCLYALLTMASIDYAP